MALLFECGPTIKAEELSRINPESFDLEQLMDHKNEIFKIYNFLLSIRNSLRPMSSDERANVKRWIDKLLFCITRSNDLIKISQSRTSLIDDSSDSKISKIYKKSNVLKNVY